MSDGKVQKGSPGIYDEASPSERDRRLRIATHIPIAHLGALPAARPDLEWIEVPASGPVAAAAPFDVLLTPPYGTPNLPALLAQGVRWVHAYGTGVDGFPFGVLGDVPLTCSRGASATAISEWVMAVLLAAEKRLPEIWLSAPPERWYMAELGSLAGRRLALVGFGGIARAIARRALPFEMSIRALRRTRAPSPIPEVELVTDLEALLDGADHVVLAAPETPATRRMIDDAAFAAMKPGVHLVNVARGPLVDHDALRRALDGGRVGLATLDCVEPEPLPEGHWLYAHPRVRLSPHVSWCAPASRGGLVEPFLENVERFLRGEPLVNRVDPGEGY
ncbi:MAG: NAD(P)-dependent oxidoreductase [Myxococcota bacterium]